MIVSLAAPSGVARTFAMSISLRATNTAIRKPGKAARLSSRSMIQGLRSGGFTKEIRFKPKPSAANSPALGSTRRGFWKADFFGASPVASALDRCTGRDPDTHSSTLSSPTHSCGNGNQEFSWAKTFHSRTKSGSCLWCPTSALHVHARGAGEINIERRRNVAIEKVDWLQAAPEDESARRDYFIRLLASLARCVSAHELQECVRKSLPRDSSNASPDNETGERNGSGRSAGRATRAPRDSPGGAHFERR